MDRAAMAHRMVPEDRSRLAILQAGAAGSLCDRIIERLQEDAAILVTALTAETAEALIHDVCVRLGLLERLRAQAGFADFHGHRRRIGQYGMSVNRRTDYQFIVPHSEADSFVNMQLASFFCSENSTDGGETILMNVDDASDCWDVLKERVTRLAPTSRRLAAGELVKVTAMYRLHSPPWLRADDEVLAERPCNIPGVKLVEALARVRRTRSVILRRDLRGYWNSVASADFDSLHSFAALLGQCGLLRAPDAALSLDAMDNFSGTRTWSSGVDHNRLFRCRITHKLAPGELVLMNNLSWAHAASNWTPGSGVRRVSAAFA